MTIESRYNQFSVLDSTTFSPSLQGTSEAKFSTTVCVQKDTRTVYWDYLYHLISPPPQLLLLYCYTYQSHTNKHTLRLNINLTTTLNARFSLLLVSTSLIRMLVKRSTSINENSKSRLARHKRQSCFVGAGAYGGCAFTWWRHA
jgi:hypothetical protein